MGRGGREVEGQDEREKEERGIKGGKGREKSGRVSRLALLFPHFKPCMYPTTFMSVHLK